MTPKTSKLAACLALTLVAACASQTADDTESQHEDIKDGQVEGGYPAVGCLTSPGSNGCNCSGTLIAPNLVLTAKHCGLLSEFRTGTFASVPVEKRSVDSRVVFHDEDDQIYQRDMEILHLSSPIFTVRPLPINTGSLPAGGTNCVAVGWGLDNWGNSGTKKSASVKVVQSGPITIDIPILGIPVHTVFASAVNVVAGSPTASPPGGTTDSGDSGGPLICNGVIAGTLVGGWGGAPGDFYTALDTENQDSYSSMWVTNVAYDYINEPMVAVAASDPLARFDLFVRGTDGAIYQKTATNNQWQPSLFGWTYLGGYITGTIDAVSWGTNRIDLFFRGGDGDPKRDDVNTMSLWHLFWNGSTWTWQNLGGVLVGHPSVVSSKPNRLDVFAVGTDAAMYHVGGDGQNFGWTQVPGGANAPKFLGPVKAFSTAQNQVDVYAVDQSRTLWHTHLNTTTGLSWQGSWDNLGGQVLGTPAVVSMSAGRQDIFVRRTDKAIYQKTFANGTFSPSGTGFTYLGGSAVGSPAAASWASNRMWLVAEGSESFRPNEGVMIKGWFGSGTWSPSNTTFNSLGNIPDPASLTMLSMGANGVNLLTVAHQFTPYINGWSPNGPQPFGWSAFGSLGGIISW